MSVCLSVLYRSTHCSSDCDKTFTSNCKHPWGGFGNLIYIKINVCVPIGAHTVHPIAMKLYQVVVNIPAVVLEI